MGLWRNITVAGMTLTLGMLTAGGPALAQNNAAEAAKIQAAVKGAWKTPTGSCDQAFFKTAEDMKTVRGEPGMKVTAVNAGMTVTGTLILSGAREGQVVNSTSDLMMMLLEPQDDGKLHVIPLNGPVAGWPEAVLDLCPGSR